MSQRLGTSTDAAVPVTVTASVLYAVRAAGPERLHDLCAAGELRPGPVPFIEQQAGRGGSDERSDRSRAFAPHVADALYETRFHAAATDGSWAKRATALEQRSGLTVEWVELLVFADEPDALRLERVSVRVRAEVSTGVALIHLASSDPIAVRALTSRAAQDTHDAVRAFVESLGMFRTETFGDLMDTAELPYLAVVAIHPADPERALDAGADLIARSATGAPRRSDVGGWRTLLWPDAAVIAAAAGDDADYRLAKRTANVARSVVLDGLLLRFAQRQTLEMLARRVASGAGISGSSLTDLHASALRLRARVWWPRISLEPFVDEPAQLLSETWALPELARDVFDELEALAQQARLTSDERIARILFFLTVGSVAIAIAALVVQVVTSGHVGAAVVAAVVPTTAAAVFGWMIYRRTFR
jgi:hypothetical protein